MNQRKMGRWVGLCALVLATSACAGVDVERVNDPSADFELINGAIRIGPNSQVGSLETVNGSIAVGDRCQVKGIEVVNGAITLGDHVEAGDIESVNGGITAGAALRVDAGIESVNGDIQLGPGARVRGGIETVNGQISFENARIEGGIETVNSSIDTGANSVIVGDIVYERPEGQLRSVPRLVIGPGTRVEGDVRLDREVAVSIHETARITGRIKRSWQQAGIQL